MSEEFRGVEENIKKIKRRMARDVRKQFKYAEYFLVFLFSGMFMYWMTHYVFDVCVIYWLKDPQAQFARELWNVLMYAIPFTFWSVAVACLVTVVLLHLSAYIDTAMNIYWLKRRMSRDTEFPGGDDAAN